MKVRDNLFWYPKFEPYAHIFGRGLGANVFALDQGDDIWLFDAGLSIMNRDENVVKFMKEDGLDPKNISKVFLTHAHPDHMNAVNFFKDLCDPSIHLHQEDLDKLDMDRHQWLEKQINRIESYWPVKSITKLFAKLVTFFMYWTMGAQYPISQDAVGDGIFNGDEVFSGDRFVVKALHTPGHTEGHTSYYIEELQALMSGDSVNPVFSNKPALNTFDADSKRYVPSIERMLKLDVEFLCTAHGELVHEGDVETRKIRRDALEKLKVAKQVVRNIVKDSGEKGVTSRDLRNTLPKEGWTAIDQKVTPLVIAMELIDERIIENRQSKFYYLRG